MRFLTCIWITVLCAYALGDTVAFVDVTVLPMDRERLIAGQTVVVDDGRISAIGERVDVEVPAGARRIDASGLYLMPGLVEMHAHVPASDAQVDRVLALFLANGVTTIRGMLGSPDHLPLRDALASGKRTGPRLVTSGPSLNGRSVTSPTQARRMVEQQNAAGYDFIKLHPGLTRSQFDAIVEAARQLDMPLAGHVSEDVGIARALESGQDSIDHLDGYMQALVGDKAQRTGMDAGFFGVGLAGLVDESKIDEIAKRTAAAGVWNVPTQTLIEHYVSSESPSVLAARDEMRFMPAATVESWRRAKRNLLANEQYDADTALRAIDVRRKLIKALHDNGAGLLLGSDAPQVFNVPGFSTHEELELLVASGLTPFAALVTGTVNPARYFRLADSRGQVAEGHDADLVLLERNPLDDIAHVRTVVGVMVGGRWLDRAGIDALLEQY